MNLHYKIQYIFIVYYIYLLINYLFLHLNNLLKCLNYVWMLKYSDIQPKFEF